MPAKKRKRESSVSVDLTSVPASVPHFPETSGTATRDNATAPESSTVSGETQDQDEDAPADSTGGLPQDGEYEEI